MSNIGQQKGKQRRHVQDLNSNAMPMGGGMPPNGAAAFATPIVNQGNHAPEFARPPYGTHIELMSNPPMSGPQGGPSMILPSGNTIHLEQPSQYAMGTVPQNMRVPVNNPNLQWNGAPQHQPQQQMVNTNSMGHPHMNASRNVQQQQQGRQPYTQPQQQQQQPMGYYQPTSAQYAQYAAMQPVYAPQYQTPEQLAYAQQQYMQQQYVYQQQAAAQQNQMMSQQQQQHMQQQQHQTGGVAPSAMQMNAPPSLQQQQGGGGGMNGGPQMGGVPTTQQQSMHGQVPPVSGSQPMHQGGAPVSAPTVVPSGPYIPAYRPLQQEQTRPQAAPLEKKTKKVLTIVNPETNEILNQTAVEASKKEEDDAPKAEKEEAKGTDETDHAVVPDIKKQFSDQILEQTVKSDQPAPAPTPDVAPATVEPKKKNILFSLEQLEVFGLKDKVGHVPAPPTFAPSRNSGPSAPPAVAAPVTVAASTVEEKQTPVVVPPVVPAAAAAASEYLPEPLAEPAYPNNYKEKQAEQSSPNTTLTTEMTATNHDEPQHPDGSHLLTPETTPPHDEPASSSSEKNTSNDSAICVQTPVTPSPPTKEVEKVVAVEESVAETVVEDVSAVEDERDEKAAEQEEEPEELTSKLEQLVIVDHSSENEAESEPSTPAPVTPSVSETTTALEEEEEDAEKIAAEIEEKRQQKRAELEAAIAANMEDTDQFLEEIGRYNREYLYNIRDIEKLFGLTDCPLTSQQLKDFGICRSQASSETRKKQDGQGGFMPSWGQRQGGGGGGGGPRSDRKQPYQGRQSEQHHRGGGGGGPRQGSNKKLPPSIRPSIERRVDTNVQLHKAEKAWKPEKVAETDLEDDEVKKKLLLKNIRSLFNKITPTTKDQLINEFLDYQVYQSPSLNEVISIIFDKAVEEPKFCPLYANMCITQVTEELKSTNNVSNFRNAILFRAQDTFTNKNMEEDRLQKEEAIAAETDEKKKREKQIELLEATSRFRRRKFGNITFIGQLYLQNLISVRIILFCVFDLLKSVTEKPADITGYEADEESVDCAVRLLETIGKRLQDNNTKELQAAKDAAAQAQKDKEKKVISRNPQPAAPAAKQQTTFPLNETFSTLESAMPIVSSRIKFMIMNLTELKKNNWIPRKTADAGPKKLDEIKNDIKKEAMENAQQAAAYERKQSHGGMGGGGRHMGGGGGHGGHGGGGGGHGGNPKRQIIQRNSSDRATVEERRSQAVKSSNLATKGVAQKKISLSSVTGSDRASLGGERKNKWSTGASGGSENSKKEERAAAISNTNRFINPGQRSSSSASMKGAEDEGASASGNATQANSDDEREQNEQREKQEADITKRLIGSIGDYASGEIKFEEARDEVLNTVTEEKYSKPSLQTIFKCFMTAAIKKAVKDGFETAVQSGNILAVSLVQKSEEKDVKGREEILKGIADSCKDIVEQEQWEDSPKIWDIVAEVLIHAHLPEEGLFVGAHPTLVDFKDAFLNAAKDDRKPYTLFVLVLKRLAEAHYKRDKDSYMEVLSWVLDECEKITKHMKTEKLNKALTDTEMSWGKNLHDIMRQDH